MARQIFARSVAAKLAGVVFILVLVLLSAFSWGLSDYARTLLARKGIAELEARTDLLLSMVASYDAALTQESDRLMSVFSGGFEGRFSIDTENRVRVGDQTVPTLRDGGTILNLDLSAVDRFADLAHSVATIFVRDGEDFLRVATSLKDEQGQRAMGTWLGKQHPGYASLIAGRDYSGKATLFGRDYMTRYKPILADGQVIGLLFIGIDFTEGLDALKQQIRSLKVEDSGYFFVLDANPGAHYGQLLVHPAKEGQVILDTKDADGRAFIAEMLEKKQGVIRYPWMNAELNETEPRDKIAVHAHYPHWNWVIGGGTYLDEFARDATLLRNATLAASAGLLLAVGIILVLMTRRLITQPLRQVIGVFARIGAGDYGSRIDGARQDEIGVMLKALDGMQTNLAERAASEQRVANEMRRVTSALDKASTNMMVADPDGTLVYMNEAFTAMMREAEADIRQAIPGFAAAGLLGRGFADFHKNPAHQRGLLEGLKGTYVSQMRVGGRTFKLIANPVLDDRGARLGTVVEWVDRTAEVIAEGELDTLLDAVAHGDFSQRLSIDGKSGFFRELADGVNNLTEIVSKALDDLATVLKAVARADLTKRIESRYKGRFAELKQDTNATVQQLERLVRQILEATDAINTAAGEIAAGNADLSARTEEQASSLEETASSMEEFNASIQQNSGSAGNARALVCLANERALAGGVLVQRVVDTMGGIQQSSQHIVDIIGVIDSIAFQTNILALNAAVEAARAGEQGRGFAVVAAEVRTLAQRSAQAAKEIKQLIGDSVAKVDDGARLVKETGTTMETIVSSFQQVVSLVTEIAEASREQEEGIGQVTKAITLMDEATQRNAALVEEAAAAAESLEDQARILSRTVSVFNMDDGRQRNGSPMASQADDIDFDEFVYIHKQWSKKLRRVVEGRAEPQNPEIVSCDDKCSLGQWIHGAGSQFKTVPVYTVLRAKHAQFHQCAGDVLRHVIVGERERADLVLSERFAPLSEETIEQIRRLEQHCQHDHSEQDVGMRLVS
ncbi:Cache 3/Cache 2 fusion domain-containing protein [Thiocystis violacea]|uniref:Cache 3/Cache 2 fusion domain-containing protein n=1 Tax=Thiocystis violacea TaxID=13725 RepID=UPI001908FD83|nr:Cache 3/Cache 2 fusion domain-containing protein [Thiocystis violacea]MBK1718180.1 hypothetical protein [Thiocystis violacea]